MFVATGARDQLLERRRSEFADQLWCPCSRRPMSSASASTRSARSSPRRGRAVSAAVTLDGVGMRFRGHSVLAGVTTAFREDTISGLGHPFPDWADESRGGFGAGTGCGLRAASGGGVGMPAGPAAGWLRAPCGKGCPAASYSPTPFPGQYHRR